MTVISPKVTPRSYYFTVLLAKIDAPGVQAYHTYHSDVRA